MERKFNPNFLKHEMEKGVMTDELSQRLLIDLCQVFDDLLAPVFVDREEWDSLDTVLFTDTDGKSRFYVPIDIRPVEIVDIIKSISESEGDTALEEGKLKELGDYVRDTASYLREYIPKIGKGQDIAVTMADQFSDYAGTFPMDGRKREINIPLSEERKAEMDEWLLGSERYQKRIDRYDIIDVKEVEKRRARALRAYFGALSKDGSSRESSTAPWEHMSGPAQVLQEKTMEGLERVATEPNLSLHEAVAKRGMRRLTREKTEVDPIFGLFSHLLENDPNFSESEVKSVREDVYPDVIERLKVIGIEISSTKLKLKEKLRIPALKQELDELRTKGTLAEISKRELEIVDYIQAEIRKFLYKKLAYIPSEVVDSDYLNCVVANAIGLALLEELGLTTLLVSIPRHVFSLVFTRDGVCHTRDFTPPEGPIPNMEISSSEIVTDSHHTVSSADDLWKFAHSNEVAVDTMFHIGGEMIEARVYKREVGAYLTIMKNFGISHIKKEDYIYAEKIFEFITRIDPEDVESMKILVRCMINNGECELSIETCKKMIDIDPSDYEVFLILGESYQFSGRVSEAVHAYEKFLELAGRGPVGNVDDYEHLYSIISDISQKVKKLKKQLKRKNRGSWMDRLKNFFGKK
jgi:tetratricopeptide (TPR) repeat protein